MNENQYGKVYVSPNALFHGKMYSFLDTNNNCLGSFVGSSNLSSFLSTTQNYIESDIYMDGVDAMTVDARILNVIQNIGVDFSVAEPIVDFLEDETDLLKGNERVSKISDDEFNSFMTTLTNRVVEIPLKTEPKSNLNTYFGAGKTPGRYSPRSWYEVELIVPKNTPNVELLPDKNSGPFKVITPKHYLFYSSFASDLGRRPGEV